jgi:hypothetical protein
MTDLVAAQITDVFRIGLVIALFATALRTRQTVGLAVPLAAGVVFVAAIIPLTTGPGAPFLPAFTAGLVTNAILLAVVGAAWAASARLRG